MVSVWPPLPLPIVWIEDNEEHIAKKKVFPDEVEYVLLVAQPRYRRRGRRGSSLVYGQTAAGRYLLVITVPAYGGGTYPVTARELTTSEKREFRRKAKRHG